MNESFVFYASYHEAIQCLPEEIQLEAYKAICEYALTGKEPEGCNPIVSAIFKMAKPTVESNLARRENGKLGGAPKGNKNAKKNKQVENKNNLKNNLNNHRLILKQPNENENVNVNDNVNVSEEEIIKEEKQLQNQFEEFWNYYTPVKGKDGHFVAKGSKQACLKKYINLLKEGIKHETIIGNLEKYLRYCQENGYSSCGAEVYLNQRRFENDYSGIECVDSKARDIQRGSVNYAKIAAELARESPYDDKDCIPF